MNKVILIGRLVRQPELRQTQGGNVVANFTIAVDRAYKKDSEQTADFIPVVAWGKRAETVGKYLDKGSKVAVSGRIQTRSYEANDGSKRYITEIFADEVEFLTYKEKTSQEPNNSSYGAYEPEPIYSFEEIDDLDVPF